MSDVQRIALESWLGQTYRTIIHRHNDTFTAIDESERKLVRADTLEDLADALFVWPHGTEPLGPTRYFKVPA